ncbi:uncharacterized protein LOC135818382 [Sycon ciliatum]|uniref:uncharacterized protein LOC135818382 n=1 Tax=Sycon ciliatum TaxID=27933 RepID=UPI0031F6F608
MMDDQPQHVSMKAVKESPAVHPERCTQNQEPYTSAYQRDKHNWSDQTYAKQTKYVLNDSHADELPGAIGEQHKKHWFRGEQRIPNWLFALVICLGLALVSSVSLLSYKVVWPSNENQQCLCTDQHSGEHTHAKSKIDDAQQAPMSNVTGAKSWEQREADCQHERKTLVELLKQYNTQRWHEMQQPAISSQTCLVCELRSQVSTINASFSECNVQRNELTTNVTSCIRNLQLATVDVQKQRGWLERCLRSHTLARKKLAAATVLIKKKDSTPKSCAKRKRKLSKDKKAQVSTLNASLLECKAQRNEVATNVISCRGHLHFARVDGQRNRRKLQRCMRSHTLGQKKLAAAKVSIKKKNASQKSCAKRKRKLSKDKKALTQKLATKENEIAQLTHENSVLQHNNRVLFSQLETRHTRERKTGLDATHAHAVSLANIENSISYWADFLADSNVRSMVGEELSLIGEARINIVRELKYAKYEFPRETRALVMAGKTHIVEQPSIMFTESTCPEQKVFQFSSEPVENPENSVIITIIEKCLFEFRLISQWVTNYLERIPEAKSEGVPSENVGINSSKPHWVGLEVPSVETLPRIILRNIALMGPTILLPLIVFLFREITTGKLRASDIPSVISQTLLFNLISEIATATAALTFLPVIIWYFSTLFPFILRWLVSMAFTTISSIYDVVNGNGYAWVTSEAPVRPAQSRATRSRAQTLRRNRSRSAH